MCMCEVSVFCAQTPGPGVPKQSSSARCSGAERGEREREREMKKEAIAKNCGYHSMRAATISNSTQRTSTHVYAQKHDDDVENDEGRRTR